MRSSRTLCAALLVCGLLLTSAACGRQVTVEPPPSPTDACSTLQLPETIDGAGRRPTAPQSTATAAWGEPPIVLRCGVGRPPTLTPSAQLITVNGISWLPIEATGGVVFVSTDWPDASHPVYVELTVPAAYSPEVNSLADLSPAFGGQ